MSRSDYPEHSSRDLRRRRRREQEQSYDVYEQNSLIDPILMQEMRNLAGSIGRNEIVSREKNATQNEFSKVIREHFQHHKGEKKSFNRNFVNLPLERMSSDRIRAARNIVKGFKESNVSQRTKERYRELSDRLKRKGCFPEQIAGTKKSFYAYRAAEVYRNKVELKSALRDRDRSYRHKDFVAAQTAESRIRDTLEFFDRYRPGGTREENMQRQINIRIDESNGRSNGKRASVSSLPANWREKVWETATARDHDVIAITAVTGLRPSELEKGVQICRMKNNLEFRILGAKVDNIRQKGQAYRKISISLDDLRSSVEGRHLIQAQTGRYRQVVLNGSAKAFSARMNRAGQRAFPGANEKVSPYTYRHAFSARLKSAGRSPEEVAKALGHQAERSQQEYGRKSQAKNAGSGGIASASAPKSVRRIR